jgi:hypothetical protein
MRLSPASPAFSASRSIEAVMRAEIVFLVLQISDQLKICPTRSMRLFMVALSLFQTCSVLLDRPTYKALGGTYPGCGMHDILSGIEDKLEGLLTDFGNKLQHITCSINV